MASPTRIYIVREVFEKEPAARLVRAISQAQALKHVAEKRYLVDVANQEEIVSQMSKGVEVEDARAEEGL